MGADVTGSADLNTIAHVIQTALTPVFLLSGIGSLLNVFNQRLARVSDHYSHLYELLQTAEEDATAGLLRHLSRLSQRRVALDASVAFAAAAGAMTCAAAFALFLVTLRDSESGTALAWLFGAALFCTIAGLVAFIVDTALAWHGLRMDGPTPRQKVSS
jgi:hypothetical protein